MLELSCISTDISSGYQTVWIGDIPSGKPPSKRQPLSLENCAQKALLNHLATLCHESTYEDNRRGLKHFLKFELPPTVRQQLVNECFTHSRIYSLIDVNLLELLLSPCVRELRVQGVRSFFQGRFSTILEQLGTGLEVLLIDDKSWGGCRQPLNFALSHLRHLRALSLRGFATDSMLNVISKTCGNLQELDITGSQQVTDRGIALLCRPSQSLNEQDTSCQCHRTKSSRKSSSPGIISSKGSWMPKLMTNLRRHSVTPKSSAHLTTTTSTESDKETLAIVAPSCLTTLHSIALTGTAVTVKGIQLLKTYQPKLYITY